MTIGLNKRYLCEEQYDFKIGKTTKIPEIIRENEYFPVKQFLFYNEVHTYLKNHGNKPPQNTSFAG
jgi:hypothetical protein